MEMEVIIDSQGVVFVETVTGIVRIRQGTDMVDLDPASLDALITALQTIKEKVDEKDI